MNWINDIVGRMILFFSEWGGRFWEQLNLSQAPLWQTTIDILLVAMLFYGIITLLKGTRTVQILVGLFILTGLYVLSERLNLLAVNWILSRTFSVILISIPIIFHPEIRRGLERLGKTRLFDQEIARRDRLISDMVEACGTLAKHREGALIVFERGTKLTEYIETGQAMDAVLSKELLLAIFNPKSPLHDGAVIVRDQRIAAAGCLLPNTFKEYDSKWGTRHKAALGLSENSDAEVIVVSEERKVISYAKDGVLIEVSLEQLQKRLDRLYKTRKELSSAKPKER